MNLHWKESETFLFADEIILCIENPKEPPSSKTIRSNTGAQQGYRV